ncbi:MAG TPA: GNAT family N-acetyltransferase [Egibacteraceae bacterium]|nr:GNAT family N-acetyltransferase [Egibacteraceae bacterium]
MAISAIRPVTPEAWDDLAELFGPSGAYSGCWCMWWRVTGRQFSQNGNAGNRAALQALVSGGCEPGLLAYDERRPAGWCAVSPRDQLGRVLRSPTLKPAEADPGEGVWSVSCFYIPRDRRGQGLATALLDAAVAFARSRGATAIEGYPLDPRGQRRPSAELYTGTPSMFARAGFSEVARRSQARAVMRRELR